MLAADIIVPASLTCFYFMTALLNAVIDRGDAFYQQLERKTFYFLITCGVVPGTGAMEAGEIRSPAAMANAYQIGRDVCSW